MTYFIYALQNKLDNKLYVGYTSNLKRRRREHFKFGYKPMLNKHLYNAMKKYGIDNFVFTVLEEFEDSLDAFAAETFWIEYFRSWDHDFGYNDSRGGESGSKGRKHSSETKKRYSEERKGSLNKFASLNEEIVLSIRQNYSTTDDPLFVAKTAEQYRVSWGCIYHVLQGRSWKHIPMIERTKPIVRQEATKIKISKSKKGHTTSIGSKNVNAILTENQVREMRRLFVISDKSVNTKKSLAQQFNITYENASQILSGRRWKHVK